jgi:hypothetical protein
VRAVDDACAAKSTSLAAVIAALSMIAVNEDPATQAVVIALIADPADYKPTDTCEIVDTLADTLNEIGERQ